MALFVSYVTFMSDIEECLRSTLEDDHMLLFYSPSERAFGEKTLDLISEDRIKIRKLPGNLEECMFLICYEIGRLFASGKYKNITLWGGDPFPKVFNHLIQYDRNLANRLSIKPLNRRDEQKSELQFKKSDPIKPDKLEEKQKEDVSDDNGMEKKIPDTHSNENSSDNLKISSTGEQKNSFASNKKNNVNKKGNKRNHKGSQKEPPKAYSQKEVSEEMFQNLFFCESDGLTTMEHSNSSDKIPEDKKTDRETIVPIPKETAPESTPEVATSQDSLSMNDPSNSLKERQKVEPAVQINSPLEETIRNKQIELNKKNETVQNRKNEEKIAMRERRQQPAVSSVDSHDTAATETLDSKLYERSFEDFWNLLNQICQEAINEDNAHNVYISVIACCGASSPDLAKRIYKDKLSEFSFSPKRAEAMYKKTQSNFDKLLNFFSA